MPILNRKLPHVHSILGCNRPRKPRTFGVGLLEADEPTTGHLYWTDELIHLESLLTDATAERAAETRRRIDGVLAMLDPDREDRERLERQREASYQFGLMVDALAHGRQDGNNWEEAELCRV